MDWRVLVSQHSWCTVPDVVYNLAAAAAVADDVDVEEEEQTHFVECSRCLEERC